MNEKIKNLIIYITVFLVIFASFTIPNILIKMKDYKIQIAVYEKQKNKSNIYFKEEEIYLVKAIHDIESEETQLLISKNMNKAAIYSDIDNENINNIEREMEQEISRLKEYNVIKDLYIEENVNKSIEIFDKIYDTKNNQYKISKMYLTINENEINVDKESKSGKIISILFKRGYLYNEIETKETIKNYIRYLNLDIIDDWTWEDNMMKSTKAGLLVSLNRSGNTYILSIHSIHNELNNNLVEFTIRNWYKFDTN